MKKQELKNRSITDLQGLLAGADLLGSVEILQEIRSRLDSPDPDLLIALAVRLFALGDDNKAAHYMKLALDEQPDNANALRLQLFFAAANDSIDASSLCKNLLKLNPSDDWVAGICRKVAESNTNSLSLPPLPSYWENLATKGALRS